MPDNVRENWLTAEQIAAIRAELPEYLSPVLRFAELTGWRKGEILDLQWEFIDRANSVINLPSRRSKNGKARPINYRTYTPLVDLIEAQWGQRAVAGGIVPWVFHRNGNRIGHDIRRPWNKARRKVAEDLDPTVAIATFHDTRRVAVRNMEWAGVSRSVAMSITGHKTESVYKRYAIVDRSAQEHGFAKMAQHHQAQKTA